MTEPALLLELRRYRLRPGARDTLVELFARELVEPQRQVGLQILGWFDDVDEPDHFVWLRGYPTRSAEARAASLTAFYGGPVWRAHREAANATMLDSDDVHLLEASDSGPVRLPDLGRQLRLTVLPLHDGPLPPGALVTSSVPNLFPALPVHDEHVAVILGEGPVRLRPRR